MELRQGLHVHAGSFLWEGSALVTGWHSHDVHQIEYAVGGAVEVETAAGHHLLPPHQAAWIPAGLRHQARMSPSVKTISVMFDPELMPDAGRRARILAVSPLLREMVIHSLRWPVDRTDNDEVAARFFRAMCDVIRESMEHETPLSLPVSDDPLVANAMAYTRENLAVVTVTDVSRAIAVSERTLRRMFQDSVGMSWRTYVFNARMHRAMALLASPGQTIQETAAAVGFENLSAFTRAFTQFAGQTPSAFRRGASMPAPVGVGAG
nr:helix-turn-helix transcriptional regulator [Gordonia rhizosphera]